MQFARALGTYALLVRVRDTYHCRGGSGEQRQLKLQKFSLIINNKYLLNTELLIFLSKLYKALINLNKWVYPCYTHLFKLGFEPNSPCVPNSYKPEHLAHLKTFNECSRNIFFVFYRQAPSKIMTYSENCISKFDLLYCPYFFSIIKTKSIHNHKDNNPI